MMWFRHCFNRHYGLVWDNYSYSEFNDIKGSYYLWSEVADEINYFFIYGENTDSIVSAYRLLTGKAPLFRNGLMDICSQNKNMIHRTRSYQS